MKKCRITFACLILSWIGCMGKISAESEFFPNELQSLYAHSAVVIDGNSGRVLFGKNSEKKMPMASTTKIMTCILALEMGNPEDTAQVSERAALQPEVRLGASVGETFYMGDLLYALMLESYNDAAVMIAEAISGSVELFTMQMDQKARDLGCEHTHFVTPNGLDGEDEEGIHETCARDLAQIMKYCVWDSVKAEEFLKITQTRQYSFFNVQGDREYVCSNHNTFPDQYPAVISGKTGFTSAAGYCYVCAAQMGERKFAAVVLASGWPYNRTYKWQDMKKLLDYAKTHYYEVNLPYPEKQRTVEVDHGWEKGRNPWENIQIPVYFERKKDNKFLLGDSEILIRRIEWRKKVKAPIMKDEILGRIQFNIGEKVVWEGMIRASKAVIRPVLKNWFDWTLQKILL